MADVVVGAEYGFQATGGGNGGWRHGRVCAVELGFVLLEWLGEQDAWDEPVREWVPRGLFDHTYQLVARLVSRREVRP